MRKLLGILLWCWSSVALANGQSTHLWISQHALTHLPEGELRELLSREDVSTMLANGTMFPDGGYAIDDDYGELAHWERFQDSYLEWILANEPPPFSDAGAEHVAFLMGLASHGMADQVFDSLFMERSKLYDTWGDEVYDSLDAASDVLFVAETGPQEVPDAWAPNSLFVDLYGEELNYEVSQDTLADGQTRLAAALVWVTLMSETPGKVEEFSAQYPWAAAHLLDGDMPGSPPCEGEVIAGYWQIVWERLHDRQWTEQPVLTTFPKDGDTGHVVDADKVESRITVVFSRALSEKKLSADSFEVRTEDGEILEVSPWLFYGNNSHVVHLSPNTDLALDTVYQVTVRPGVAGRDGLESTAEVQFQFRTAAAESETGCGCRVLAGKAGAAWVGLGMLLAVGRRRRLAAD